MAITRTHFIDDDGSGTTGTIWNDAEKQVLYDQIDAVVAGGKPTYGTYPLVDGSGAGLGTLATGYYARLDRTVWLWAQVIYPATTNGLAAKISGVPFANAAATGFYITYGPPNLWHVAVGVTDITVFHPSTLAARTNVDLSGSNTVIVGHMLLPG